MKQRKMTRNSFYARRRTIKQALALSMAIGVAILGDTTSAEAHAVVLEAKPANNATLVGSNFEPSLRFNARIDHKKSRMSLVSMSNKITTLEIVQETAPDIMKARPIDIAPGRYRLRWQVLAMDGHISHGDITFSVTTP
ncbi:hypothetical protein CCP2SC5_270009 [Azospirillaceae bacterium]